MFIIHVLQLVHIFNIAILLRFLCCPMSRTNFRVPVMQVPVMQLFHTSVRLRDILALGFRNMCTTKPSIHHHIQICQNCKINNTDLNGFKASRFCSCAGRERFVCFCRDNAKFQKKACSSTVVKIDEYACKEKF